MDFGVMADTSISYSDVVARVPRRFKYEPCQKGVLGADQAAPELFRIHGCTRIEE